MGTRVYTCVQWDEIAQTCSAGAWIEQASILDALPTVDQANTVGMAIFGSLALIAAMSLLTPSRTGKDE